jgi:vitamin B12 transporter
MYRDLRHVLFDIKGVYSQSDEALGSTAEVMIRGNSGSRVLTMVDGAKTNTSIFSNGRFITGASGFNLGRVEVVRGAQSTLYGSSAIGGVILLETRQGRGTPRYTFTNELGSFNSFLTAFQGQGEVGELDFSFHAASQESDNELSDNEGKMKSYSFRLDYDLSENTTVGISSRGEFTDYSNPVGDLTPPPSTRVQSDTIAVSAYVKTSRENWTQKFTASMLDEYYRQTGFIYIGDAANWSLDWQNTVDVADSLRLVAGSTWERQEGNDNSFPESESDSWALFAQAEIEAGEGVNLVLGARHDDYDIAGSKTTWRANGAWELPTKTKLRAAIGTAFRAPNFFRLFSTSSFALGNLNLKPEESKGWEVGFDQFYKNGAIQLGATYFQNDIEDLVVFVPTTGFDGTYANRDSAENYGLEAYVSYQMKENWSANLAYTWTESSATDLSLNTTSRLPGVPRHQISLNNEFRIDENWLVGSGLNYVIGRESFGSVDIDNYLLVRGYSRYRFSDAVSLTARVENALNEDYTVSFSSFSGRVPARGFAAFAGVEWRF